MGVFAILSAILAYTSPRIRRIETELPDVEIEAEETDGEAELEAGDDLDLLFITYRLGEVGTNGARILRFGAGGLNDRPVGVVGIVRHLLQPVRHLENRRVDVGTGLKGQRHPAEAVGARSRAELALRAVRTAGGR